MPWPARAAGAAARSRSTAAARRIHPLGGSVPHSTGSIARSKAASARRHSLRLPPARHVRGRATEEGTLPASVAGAGVLPRVGAGLPIEVVGAELVRAEQLRVAGALVGQDGSRA